MTTRAWLAAQLDKKQYRDYNNQLCALLRDGFDLCLLLTKLGVADLHPNANPTLRQRGENIAAFLGACAAAGITPCFTQLDIAEGREQPVTRTLEAIRSRTSSSTPPQSSGGTPTSPPPASGAATRPPSFGLSVRAPGTATPVAADTPPGTRKTASATASAAASPSGSPLQPARRAHSDAAVKDAAAPAVRVSTAAAATAATTQQPATTQADDMRLKAAFKYGPEVHECIREWIRAVLADPASIAPGADLGRTLKDGVLLCRLINALVPGSAPKAYEGAIAFRQIENVSNYLHAVAGLGLRKEDLFDVPDLFEGRNINMVIQHLQALAQTVAKRPGYKGPVIKSSSHVKSLFAQALTGQEAPESIAPSGPLSEEEQKMVTWLNARLRPLLLSVADLSSDLRNGVKLAKLVELLSGGLAPTYNDQPTTLWHMMHNASQFLNFLNQHSIVTDTDCSPQDIVTGNREKILGLLKLIREHFDLEFVFESALNQGPASSPSPSPPPTTTATATAAATPTPISPTTPPASSKPVAASAMTLSQSDLAAFEEEERKFSETLRQKSGFIERPSLQLPRKDSRETRELEERKKRYMTRKRIREERRLSGLSPVLQSDTAEPEFSLAESATSHGIPTRPRAGAVSGRPLPPTPKPTPPTSATTTPVSSPVLTPLPSEGEADRKSLTKSDDSKKEVKDKDRHHRHHHHKDKEEKKKSKDEKRKSKDSAAEAEKEPQTTSQQSTPTTPPLQAPLEDESSRTRALTAPSATISFSGPAHSSWPSLEMALDDPILRADFRTFLESEFALENLLFYDDVVAYKRRLGDTKEMLFGEARRIFEEYLTADSENEINISWPTKQQVQTTIAKGVQGADLTIWDAALSEVVRLLRSDLYVRWYRTKQPPSLQQQPQQTPAPTPKSLGILGSFSDTALRILGAKEQVRARVASQLCASEKKYVDCLASACELVFEPTMQRALLSEQEAWSVFANLPLLLAYHRMLLARLEAVKAGWQSHLSTVGDIFLENTQFFMLYSVFMRNYSVSLMSYRQFRICRPDFAKLLADFESSQKLSVEQVLEMPFQRLEAYVTSLRSLQKYTPKGHRDAPMLEDAATRIVKLCEAIAKVLDTNTIKESKRLLAVADSIQGLEGQVLIVPGRRLLCQAPVTANIAATQSSDAPVVSLDDAVLFLFNDLLVCCKLAAGDQQRNAPYQFAASLTQASMCNAEQATCSGGHTGILATSNQGATWLFRGSSDKETGEWLSRLTQWLAQ